jgi:hypothetical protein
MTDDSTARDLAIKRLHQKQAFRAMLVSYVVINVFLWLIWAITDDKTGTPWPIWVTLGWGIGVAFSAWNIYGQHQITEDDVQREIQRSKGAVDTGSAA